MQDDVDVGLSERDSIFKLALPNGRLFQSS